MKYSNNTGLPSVSDIISPYEDRRFFRPEHSARGDFVHSWIACDQLGLWTPAIPEEYKPYIESYLAFKPHIIKAALVERRLTSERGYCGKPDMVAILDDAYNNLLAVVDWKTSQQAQKSWQSRIGGYSLLNKENDIPVTGGMIVRLRNKMSEQKGWFPLVDFYQDHEMREHEIDFLCSFRVYQNVLNYGKIYANYETIKQEY